MTSHYPTIAQAVVTDPLESAAGGYVLVAKSPGILAQDADFLSASPGISDYLHELQKTDESYFSFFTLPSKKYALVHRFLHDKRRGVNRVVVHLLVLSDELLRTLQENVWLLSIGQNFQVVGDTETQQTFSLTQLGDEVIKPGLRKLPELAYVLPEKNGQKTFEWLVNKRDSLQKHGKWSKEKLRHRLIGILDALVRGKQVLLPQSSDYRDMLALAWISLPIRDRRRISWTTHFTPGRVLFRLANAPEPDRARLLYPKRENCLLLKEIDELAARAQKAVQTLSARILTYTPEQLERLYQKLQSDKLSLLDDAKAVYRHLHWWKSEPLFLNFVKKGASTLEELTEMLSYYESLLEHSKQPLDGLENNVLYGICKTGSILSTPPQLEDKLKELYQKIKTHTRTVKKCLAPTLVTEFTNRYSSFQTALIAIGLAWRRFQDYESRHSLFSSFYGKYLAQWLPNNNNNNESETVSFLAKMSFELVTAYSTEINPDEPALVTLEATVDDSNNTVLDNTLDYLRKNLNPLYAAKALLKIAGQVKRTDIVADIMTRIIFPSVGKVSEDVIIEGIENSQKHPDVISLALIKLDSGKAFNMALSQLKALIDIKPKEAKKIIGDVLASKSLPKPFYKTPEIKDMTRMLDKLKLPINSLSNFVLAEAIWVVENQYEDEDFKKSLSSVVEHRTGNDTKYILDRISKLSNNQLYNTVSCIIFEGIAHKAAEVIPKDTLKFMTKALRETDKNDIINWVPIVKEIYEQVQVTKDADRLSTLWWKHLSHCDSIITPTPTDDKMLKLTGHNAFLKILKEWVPRIKTMGDEHVKLLTLFKERAEEKDFVQKYPVTYIQFLASFFASTMRHDQLKLSAVNHLGLVCDNLNQPPESFINNGLLVLFGNVQELTQQIPHLFNSEKISFTVRWIFRELVLTPTRVQRITGSQRMKT
jgi:hypothetical protein